MYNFEEINSVTTIIKKWPFIFYSSPPTLNFFYLFFYHSQINLVIPLCITKNAKCSTLEICSSAFSCCSCWNLASWPFECMNSFNFVGCSTYFVTPFWRVWCCQYCKEPQWNQNALNNILHATDFLYQIAIAWAVWAARVFPKVGYGDRKLLIEFII